MNNVSEQIKQLSDDALVIVPVRNLVLFPESVMPITLGREQSVRAAQTAVQAERPLGILLQKDPAVDQPEPRHLFPVGTSAEVLRYITSPQGSHHLVARGMARFRIKEFLPDFPFLVARIQYLEEEGNDSKEVAARALFLRQRAEETMQLLAGEQASALGNALYEIKEPGHLADIITAFLDIEAEKKQQILETLNLRQRLDLVIGYLTEQFDILKLTQELEARTRNKMDAQARKHMLQQQLETIRRELGEEDDHQETLATLQTAIEAAGMPESVEEEVRRELKRLQNMSEQSGEYTTLHTWLEWMVDLPWAKLDEEDIDIDRARQVLDEDHHGLDKVKRRILEFLAVRKLNPEGKSPILCLAGPPGVGKTSLGKSIARALGVQFTRASLGGVHDEAEIRGHRRTYIGALPGNIIRNLRKVGTRNPVFMLDEIDKLGSGIQGDPSSALLEVLDPEQNSTFADNYLGVPFDLSRVMFIATANILEAIPPPLRDRMEVIEIAGYTQEEKLVIARRYLVGRQLQANGLSETVVSIDDQALGEIIRSYTREAGVRNLERQIGALLRNAAVRIASGEESRVDLTLSDVQKVLGPPIFEPETAMHAGVAGVATGLAWTPAGGDILFIETTSAPGRGNFILTGQLGDVMRESAQAALTLVKSRARSLGIEQSFADNEIHIHVPAGAIQKDGPSAGVALFVALVSLLTRRPVPHDIAMTGEISLRGRVMRVGGVKEKVLAAVRFGVKHVILPKQNEPDWLEIPSEVRKKIKVHFVDHISQVLKVALDSK